MIGYFLSGYKPKHPTVCSYKHRQQPTTTARCFFFFFCFSSPLSLRRGHIQRLIPSSPPIADITPTWSTFLPEPSPPVPTSSSFFIKTFHADNKQQPTLGLERPGCHGNNAPLQLLRNRADRRGASSEDSARAERRRGRR